MSEDESPSLKIADAIREFIHDLEGVKSAEQIACPLIQAITKDSKEKFDEFADKFRAEPDSKEKSVTYHVPFESSREFRKLQRRLQRVNSAIYQTPRALLVAMVSTFDAYLGRLLRCMYLLRPEMIDASERAITFSELVKIKSVDAAREHIIESEIETFLRKSHIEHFEQLEKRLGMELRKGLVSWPVFVELTQRRNLFVHCDGVMSKQYMDVCSKHGVNLTGREPGKRLHLDAEYFNTSFECLYEIGVKLAHTIWRKLDPQSLENADSALNEVCFQLLDTERYGLAYQLLTFATQEQKKHSSAFNRRMLVINRAIAAKFGQIACSPAPLDSEDWSDCGLPFALAVAILKDQHPEACALMREIGSSHKLVTRMAYDTWPLFRDFRDTAEFRATYKELFGTEFRMPTLKDSESVKETEPPEASSDSTN